MRLRCLITLALILPAMAQADRNIGWQTFSAETTESSSVTLGAEYLDGRNIEALAYDGVTVNAPQIQLNVRLGDRGEAYLGHTVLRTLRGDDVDNGTNGGDPWFYTKIQMSEERGLWPATAFIWGVLEPAANQPFGADNLAFYTFLAFSKRFDAVRLDVNTGIGIYEDAVEGQQSDVAKLSLALWYEPPGEVWAVAAEYNYDEQVTGSWYDFTQGTETEYRRRRIAVSGQYGETWQGFARGSLGLVEQSERFGLSAGVRYVW